MMKLKTILCGAVALATAVSATAAAAAPVRPGASTVSAARAAQVPTRAGAPMRGENDILAALPIWLIVAAIAAIAAVVVVATDGEESP